MNKNENRKKSYAALKYSDFRFFLITKGLLVLALQIQSVVLGWHVYSLTLDPLSLGLVGLVEVIPNFSITLFAGHFTDIYNRKKMILSSLGVLLACSIGFWFISNSAISYKLWMIYLLIGVTGFARGILSPALFSVMGECVEKKDYVNSTAWHTSVWQVGGLFGAGLSGFIYQGIHFNTYILLSLLFTLAMLAFAFISPKPHANRGRQTESIRESIQMGLKFVFGSQILLAALSLDLFAVLFGGAVALLPVFAKDILKVGPTGLGFLKAAPSLGSFLMAYFLIYYPPIKKSGQILLISVFGFGLCMIMFALSKNFYLSLFSLMLSGAFDGVSVMIRGTILQTLVPDDMKGKVYSVNSLFIGSSNEIGAFESGVAARIMGTIPSVVFGGIMTLIVVMTTYKKVPSLTKFNIQE